ncbi:MAG: hypothetical protein HKN94_16050 [Acidimicrobiales bacterium]|nr:hypothetical protein [Acidimicrobiales bacterium]
MEPRIDAATSIAEIATRYVFDPPRDDDPVIEFLSPEELAQAFAGVIPIELGDNVPARSAEALASAAELVVRHSVHTSHPRFFNQNFAGPDPVAVIGDWLGAALNTTNATFEAAPVFTLMESALLRKLGRVAGYPVSDEPGSLPPGLFAPGGSSATLYALQLARHRHQPDIVRVGASADRLAIFVSDAGHYAAVKSAALLGIGMDNVIKVAADDEGAMDVTALRAEITTARERGLTPLAVIATAGTTVTSAFDAIDEIADVCDAEELWLHVDGCWGGSALFSSSHRHRLAGVERSDSFVWNLHKMMGVTQQCTALLVRDPGQLGPCFATGADYIFQPDKLHAEFDSGDRHFQCARRVDALKLWLTWQAYGDEGFEARIDHAVAMADHVRHRIRSSDDEFATIVEGDFSNVVFVWVPPELRPFDLDSLAPDHHAALHVLAPRIKGRMQAEGTVMMGYQPVAEINTFRFILNNSNVEPADIDVTLEFISQYATEEWKGV